MKKFWLFFWLWFLVVVRPVAAAELGLGVIRPERMKTGESPLPLLILVKTNSPAAVESGLRVTIGSAWSVTGEISTSVLNLPDGVTSWSNLGASSVVGQVINFGSNDLVAGVTYGFYITSGLSVNGATGDGAANKWFLETLVGNVVDSSQEIKVPIVASDLLVVTGRVGANPTDFSVDITSDSQGRELRQNEEVEYQINYGSLMAQAVRPLVVTASWGRGSVESQPGLVVDVVDYVVGSGTTAYGGVVPVVDLVNRRITWTISLFPAETVGQVVSFRLKTNDNYTGLSKVVYTVSSQLEAANVVTVGGGQVSETYRFYREPTSTPTLTPTATPTVSVGTTTVSSTTTSTSTSTVVTPTPTSGIIFPKPYPIRSVSVVSLESDAVTLEILLERQLPDFKILWGTAWGKPTKTVKILDDDLVNLVNVGGLMPEVRYYFYLSWKEGGVEGRTEWLTVATPRRTLEKALVKKGAFTVVSGDRILRDSFSSGEAVTVIPVSQPYTVKLFLERSDLISQAQLWARDKQVMGIVSAYSGPANELVNDLYSLGRGVYAADFMSPNKPGWYEYYLRIHDFTGAIYEQKVGEMSAVLPMKVVDGNSRGVERVKILLEYEDVGVNVYKVLPGSVRFPNPTFSEAGGWVDLVLPEGRYKAKASAIGYRDVETEFVVDGMMDKYPELQLVKKSWSFLDYGRYYSLATADIFDYSSRALAELASSYRFFQVVSLVVLTLMVFTSWWLFSLKVRINWWSLGPYLVYRLMHRLTKKMVVEGEVVVSDTGFPVVGAEVYVIDGKSNRVLRKLSTDVFGRFYWRLRPGVNIYKFMVVAKGYETLSFLEYDRESLLVGSLRWQLKRVENNKVWVVGRMFEGLAARIFDVLLIFSLIAELFLIRSNGVVVLPLMIVSWLNLFLVIDYWWLKGRGK